MTFDLTILGSSAAGMSLDRNQSAQILNIHEKLILIDAGEGTQKQLINCGVRSGKIELVLISHLHPDHFIGLIGLICTFNLQGRKTALTVAGPKGLRQIIEVQLNLSGSVIQYPLLFIETDTDSGKVIFENEHYTIMQFALKHRIMCCGFTITEKVTKRKMDVEKIAGLSIPIPAFDVLKNEKDYVAESGETYHWQELTVPTKIRKYTYMTDTLASDDHIQFAEGSNLLYHESTFLNDLKEKAHHTYHSTATEAAEFARKANVDHLLLGHFSIRYAPFELFLNEAQPIFPNTSLAIEGKTFSIK